MSERTIEALLLEGRRFPPPEGFRQRANVTDARVYEDAEGDPEGFWARAAGDLHWFRRWDKVLEWDLPYAKWFVGGKTNLSYNCLDRHPAARRTNRAIVLHGGPGGLVAGGLRGGQRRDGTTDEKGKVLGPADGGWRRGNVVPLKRNADEA